MPSRPAKNAEQSRRAILEAAKKEFGELGVDGARTEAIARAAGVNKALLYYYFTDKEALYGAVLDDVFAMRFQVLGSILESELPAGEKILRFARQHFDYVSGEDHYPRLVQYEMMRAAGGNSPHLPRLIQSFFRPMLARVTAVVRQGIAERRLRPVDPVHLVLSIIGVNVFHVLSAPVLKGLPLSPQTRHRPLPGTPPVAPAKSRDLIAERRAATLDFITASIFTDRDEGIRLAARIVGEPARAPAAGGGHDPAGEGKSYARRMTGGRERPKLSIRGKRS